MDGQAELVPEVAFKAPRFGGRQVWFSLLLGSFSCGLGYFSVHRTGAPIFPVFIAVGVYVALLVLLSALGQWRLRRAGGVPPIRFEADRLVLPRTVMGRRVVAVPYGDVRSVTELTRLGARLLFVDTVARPFVFAVNRFAAPDAAARIVALLQGRILALPDGAARWQAMEQRHAVGTVISAIKPWLTYGLGVVVALVLLLQLRGGVGDGFAALDWGANAPALVAAGQWWRLITANLLHANAVHLFNNLIFLLVFGAILERLVGRWHFALVVLATGVLSQAASMAAGPLLHRYIYAVGLSGALFGLLGALGMITLRFGAHLPGGYRIGRRAWIWLLGVNFAITFAVTNVDKSAHAGGLVAGALVGAVLFWSMRDVAQLRRPAPSVKGAVVGLGLIWAGGVAAAAWHARAPAVLAADRAVMMRDVLNHPGYGSAIDNQLAWTIAVDASASPALLADARRLAARAVEAAGHVPVSQRGLVLAETQDTLAVLAFRTGDTATAIDLLAPLARLWKGEYGSHLALLLARARAAGARMPLGLGMDAHALRLGQGVLQLTADDTVPFPTEVLALVRRDGALQGVLQLYVPQGFRGAQILPLPQTAYAAPGTAPPDALWLDGGADIELVWARRMPKDTPYFVMQPRFSRYDPALFPVP